MHPYRKVTPLIMVLLLTLSAAAPAGEESRAIRQGGASVGAGGSEVFDRPEESPSGITRSQVQTYMRQISRQLDGLRAQMEEWGTLNVSSLMFAQPDYREGQQNTPAFEFGLANNAGAWFAEAAKSEGFAGFAERIFNTLVVSGTLQAAPERAFAYDLQKQKVIGEKKLFESELAKRRMLEEEALDDHLAKRRALAEASQIEITTAREDVSRALAARREAEVAAQNQRTAADQAASLLRQREAELAEITATQDVKPDDEAVRRRFTAATNARNAAERASTQAAADAAAAEREVTKRRETETTARTALTTALKASPGESALQSTAKVPVQSPTIDNSLLPKEAEVNEATEAAKQAASDIAKVQREDISDLGEKAFATGAKLSTEDGAFPARSRLIEAAGNKAMQEIFNFLGDPGAALVFKDKPILFGIATVSANPGWRTRQEYDGQVDVATKYSWVPARRETLERIVEYPELFPDGIADVAERYLRTNRWSVNTGARAHTVATTKTALDQGNSSPLAVAVSPLMERQSLDLSSSRARQDEIALFLSASLSRAGLKGQGEVFDKYVKLRRQDVSTRSSVPVLNAYNIGGGIFGFQFGPRLDALDKPGSRNPKPARTLSKQAFPVLVMCGFTRSDIAPRLALDGGQIKILEPEVEFVQTTRWSRQVKRGVFHEVLHSIFLPGFPGRPMQSPSEVHRTLMEVGGAMTKYGPSIRRYATVEGDSNVAQWIDKVLADSRAMNAAYFGFTSNVAIPVDILVAPPRPKPEKPKPAAFPVVAAVFPKSVALIRHPGIPDGDRFTDIVIGGQDLDRIDTKGKIEVLADREGFAKPSEVMSGAGGKQALALRIYFSEAPTRFQLRLPVKDEEGSATGRTVFTEVVSVIPDVEVVPYMGVIPSRIVISRTAWDLAKPKEKPADPREILVEVPLTTGNVRLEQLQKARVEILEWAPLFSNSTPPVKQELVVTLEDVTAVNNAAGEFNAILKLRAPANFEQASVMLHADAPFLAGKRTLLHHIETQKILILNGH